MADVAVNEAGESFFMGDFQLFVDSLNGAVISADGASSAMVGKLSPDGQLVWIESIGGPGEDKGARVILDSLQAPIFLIESGANPYVGNVPVSTNGFKEPLITKLNPENGEFVWGKTISAKSPSGNSAASRYRALGFKTCYYRTKQNGTCF
jgi:outer membrane protein assembly factor BamB